VANLSAAELLLEKQMALWWHELFPPSMFPPSRQSRSTISAAGLQQHKLIDQRLRDASAALVSISSPLGVSVLQRTRSLSLPEHSSYALLQADEEASIQHALDALVGIDAMLMQHARPNSTGSEHLKQQLGAHQTNAGRGGTEKPNTEWSRVQNGGRWMKNRPVSVH
jgi:hypothetical protein